MKAAQLDALARQVLRGEGRAPRPVPQRIALAVALPRVAEELHCRGELVPGEAARGLLRLWTSLEDDELMKRELGTPQLAAGCLEAAELLAVELPPRRIRSRLSGVDDLPADFSLHRVKVARPRVFAPLLNDAAPARVLYTPLEAASPPQDSSVLATAALVRRFLGVEASCWRFDRPAPGKSKMAALFLRALLEQWPEAATRLAYGGWLTSWGVPCLGVTGELDAEGVALPVGWLEDKVRCFFELFPQGRLLVPASQWGEARALYERLHPPGKHASRAHHVERWWQVQPFQSVLDLLVRLGIETPAVEQTLLFKKLREASRQVPCWNGTMREVSELLDLPLLPVQRDLTGPDGTVEEGELLRETRHRWLSGERHSAFIEGGPGCGKSMVMRRLCAHLLCEAPLLGAALRVDARHLVRLGLSLEKALHDAYAASLTLEDCRLLVALAGSPALSGNVWLLVDGLDEVNADERGRIRELIAAWDGPSLLGARPLSNELPGAPHVRVGPLHESQQQSLFVLEGKPGHWTALQGRDTFPPQRGDRRRAMIADLCTTPLGVSLLAMLPEEELGADLDVPSVLRKCIIVLLERAEKTGRISRPVRRRVATTQGLGTLGAAAWSMLRRGGTLLDLDDLETASKYADEAYVDAVHEVLENSDLIQRVGLDQYQFSHKSLAELCAAIHLVREPEVESQLLPSIGEPGVDAVAFHFGALLAEPVRLTRFLHELLVNPRRPFSSLALATRLLIANGPGRVSTEVALEAFVRRLRFQSRRPRLGWRSRLLGGLDADSEMWLALERWAEPLRNHWEALLDACAPAVGKYLRGEALPLQETQRGYIMRSEEDQELHAAISFAGELAERLEPELPLAVLVRLGGKRLLERSPGAWALELEPLFDNAGEEWGASKDRAASIWAQKVPTSRHLERLDVLSRCTLNTVAPVITTVLEQPDRRIKREALLRAAINGLEFGHRDDEEWVVTLSFARKLREVSSDQLLRQWELLWASGLIGERSERNALLEPLYAEFFNDSCGPARWRALIALARVRGRVDVGLLRKALRDDFRAVRIEALVRLMEQGEAVEASEVAVSLASLEDSERCLALLLLGAGRTAPMEWVLAALSQGDDSRRSHLAPGDEDVWESPRTPWQESIRRHGADARGQLQQHLRERLKGAEGPWPALELMEGPYAQEAEELLGSMHFEDAVIQSVLATGSPKQRRVMARRFSYLSSILIPYVDDVDPEVRAQAQEAVRREERQREFEGPRREELEQQRLREKEWRRGEGRPVLSLEALAGYDTFESLWSALPRHSLPLLMESQLAMDREERARRSEVDEEEDTYRVRETVPDRQRKPIIQRLRELYTPRDQPRLLEGLADEDLAPFSVALLHEHPPVEELLQRIPQGGDQTEQAVLILRGTPHAPAAACLLCEALLDGRLKPEEPDASGNVHDPEFAARLAESSFAGWWSHCLRQLDGLAAFLPLLAEDASEKFRKQAVDNINAHWRQWERETPRRAELLDWARRAQQFQDESVRVIALRLLAIIGEPADGDRWRPALTHQDVPASVLAAAVRLVGRFGGESDLPLFRALLTHSAPVASEAVVALAHVGGASIIEELVGVLESPPSCLRHDFGNLFGSPMMTWDLARWVEAATEAILRFGDGNQAKRAARVVGSASDLWWLARRHFRLPEHLLFAVGHLRTKDPTGEHDNGYSVAERGLVRVINQVGAENARRIMLEASFWNDDFRRCFEDHIEHVGEEDLDLLLSRLREQPDNDLALFWLCQVPSGEARLHALWREKSVSWWP